MAEFITYSRWELKEDAAEAAVLDLIREAMIPAYAKLPGCLRLGLLRLRDSTNYLATQHWQDRAAYERWSRAPDPAWMESYRSPLERWHQLMTYQEDWQAEVVF